LTRFQIFVGLACKKKKLEPLELRKEKVFISIYTMTNRCNFFNFRLVKT